MRLQEFDGKRIAILGAGREGQAAYHWLIDRNPGLELTLIAEAPMDPGFVSAVRGSDRSIVEPFSAHRLSQFDVLIRSPGISPYRDALREAAALGTRITSATNVWFSAHPEARTICVTGTKGKSTTSALIAHLLGSCGFRVKLAGNIGQPLLACPDDRVDWWVVELSSYQLVDFDGTPSISVILNLSPEHLDWHLGFENYARDKLRLAERTGDNPLILNALDAALVAQFGSMPSVRWFNSNAGIHIADEKLLDRQELLPVRVPKGMPGTHNLQNVAAALTAVALAGGDLAGAARAVEQFTPLPHRLQVLGERLGITYINDSIATTPVSTLAALESLKDRPVLLIVGGLDRGLDWSAAAKSFQQFPPRAVIGIPGNGSKILAALSGAGFAPEKRLHESPDLEHAVALAQRLASAGDAIVLSPGAPSFPQFVDYRDRGHRFARFAGFAAHDEP